jgi:sugar lactone lactonase YvrE
MKILLRLLVLLVILGAYLLFWPVPIEPVAWHPSPAPSASDYPYNEHLKGIERLAENVGRGPEGVLLDAEGRVYAGFDDGRVMRFNADGSGGELLANTGGRPLGLAFGPDGQLLIADAVKHLLQLQPDGSLKTLSAGADGVPFKFVDDVDAYPGEPYLYFSDASSRFGVHEVMPDILEHGGHGRILRYDLNSGATTVLMRDLNFANGVAVGPNADYLLVNETGAYRIWRHWLKGDKAGTSEVLIDNLPGFPDNLSFNGRDRIWLALYSPRVPDLDRMAPYPFLRKVVSRLPAFVQPAPKMHSWVLGLDLDGKVVANLQYAGEKPYAPITSAEEHGEYLYFGSLSDTAIGRIKLSELP